MTLEAGSPIGKYIVKRKLAEGGMAEIYLATHKGPEGFEKEVVIKRVRAFLAGDEGFVQMFIAEARLASRLNHANVVQIFDFDKHEDSFYLSMEYVRGCSLWDLRKRCREKGLTMPPVLVAHIGAQVAAGLSHAHRLKSPDGEPFNLVHRDVTPHNVLLSLDGAVKLTDFGIAKAGNKLTQPGVLKGKFAYMSPEQARGEAVDARTDVFALGIVLWEMLTGGRLFDGDSELAVLRAVQESAIASPARLNPDVPEDLDKVVATALDRDPAARFQSASELERALAQCVLRHARSVDDTDVSAFVRRALDAPLTQFIPTPAALLDRPQHQTPREPTAVLRTDIPSGQGRSVRTPTSEASFVSASTHVLSSSEPRPERSTLPLPSVHGSHAAAPVRVAQVMPVVTSASEPVPAPAPAPEPARAKRSGMGLRAGVGVAALVLIGGVTALVVPAKQPTSPAAPPPAAAPVQTAAPAEVKAEVPAQPAPAPTAAPAPVATAPSVTAPAAEAKGTLIVTAKPFATVLITGQKPREVQGRATYSLPSGTYKVTFKHPTGDESYDVTITPGAPVTRNFVARKR
ncbi:serine/threonine-protein kinase [Archangium sp.]|uniref:serine/threonine-protein kinase n=1 Tax=Archangium sp. TaxID=1872627 RepID=UPI00286B1D06|nr:serine/threonine-protein kinase [Archangium sp.]